MHNKAATFIPLDDKKGAAGKERSDVENKEDAVILINWDKPCEENSKGNHRASNYGLGGTHL